MPKVRSKYTRKEEDKTTLCDDKKEESAGDIVPSKGSISAQILDILKQADRLMGLQSIR